MTDRLARLAAAADRLRRAVGGSSVDTGGEPVAHYVALVREQSYRITDRHIDDLREAGHSDDAIFELTVAAAFDAADERLAAALRLLDVDARP